jgi:MGT family glycosyltransferase
MRAGVLRRPLRFLFVTWNGGGTVAPTLGLARQLVGRGHSVRVLGPRSLHARIEVAGCVFAGYERVPRGTPFAAGSSRTGRLRAALVAPELARAAPALAFAGDALAELDRAPADALVVDFMLAGAIAAGERAGLPTAALMHTVYCLPVPGRPPFGPGFAERAGRAGRLRDAALSTLVRWANRHSLRDLNEARQHLGLAPVGSAAGQLAQVRRVLVLTSEALDPPPRALPANVRYVGPQLDGSWPSEVLQLPSLPEGAEPLLVVSFSSRYAATAVVQRLLDAAAKLPVRVLLTLGPALAAADLRLPANAVAVGFAPHAAVIPRAQLVITHAGLGTVMAALAHGTPLLCIPLKNDQFENAARVVAIGAGRTLSRSATRRSLRRAILHVLNEPRFGEGARRMAERIAGQGTARAIEELEALPDRRIVLEATA